MTRGLSPTDYQRSAGWRRSEAVRPLEVHALGDMAEFAGLDDPRLAGWISDGRLTSSGAFVGEMGALRNSALFRGVSLIASSIGMLPLHLMVRDGDRREKAREHPLFRVLHRRPNGYQTASEFKSFMQMAALMDGNAYAMIVRSRGAVRQLVPLKRGSVTPKLSADWTLTFDYQPDRGGKRVLAAEDVFHFRSPVSRDGLKGLSLVDLAAEAIGLATTAERAAARIFKKGAMVSGVLETQKSLGDTAYSRLKSSFDEQYGGVDAESAGGTPLLEEGLQYKAVAASAKDSQHLEQRKFQMEELSRFLGVPRPLLMFDETSWGSGIEQLGLFFVTYCLMPWFVAWEEAVSRSLLSDAEQDTHYAKFNEGALLRGSLKDQAEFFAKSLGSGGSGAYRTPNEVRDAFDLNPVENGDTLPMPSGSQPDQTKETTDG
ncbi:MAG: phage portal protein [Sphingomonas bacterium]|nr:phage portal protein [Sphingomonas bacterium]